MAAPDAPPLHIMAPIDHDHRMPFDHESEAGFDDADLTQEFWGTSRSWQPTRGHDEVGPSQRDDTTGAIRAIRDGMAAFRPQRVDLRDSTGQVRRTRTHGTGRRTDDARHDEPEASIAELAGGVPSEPVAHDPFLDDPFLGDSFQTDPVVHDPSSGVDRARDHHDDDDLVPLSATAPRRTRPSLGAVDPLLARFGALALVGVLLVPVALALRPSDPAPDSVRIDAPTVTGSGSSEAPAGGADPAPASGAVTQSDPSAEASSPTQSDASADVAAAPAEQTITADEPAAPSAAAPSNPTDADSASSESAAVADTQSAPAADADGAIGEAATVDEPAERVVPECPQTYTAGAGDSWYRIADAAGVSPGALLTENRATNDTVILPGDEICLPAGAAVPSPPPAPEPAAEPSPTTTSPPATTAAPTTTAAPAAPASVEEVKALIRATWPAEEHEMALRVAERESRFDPRADNNWCCYGVFQIYFTVHQSWLDDFGVYQASDLFDAEKNIAAAYHLWQQSGGWGPWGF